MKTTNIKKQQKNVTMHTSQLSNSKFKKYIYTEEDLGEGLLDAGVPNPSQASNVVNNLHELAERRYELIGNNTAARQKFPVAQDGIAYAYFL